MWLNVSNVLMKKKKKNYYTREEWYIYGVGGGWDRGEGAGTKIVSSARGVVLMKLWG